MPSSGEKKPDETDDYVSLSHVKERGLIALVIHSKKTGKITIPFDVEEAVWFHALLGKMIDELRLSIN